MKDGLSIQRCVTLLQPRIVRIYFQRSVPLCQLRLQETSLRKNCVGNPFSDGLKKSVWIEAIFKLNDRKEWMESSELCREVQSGGMRVNRGCADPIPKLRCQADSINDVLCDDRLISSPVKEGFNKFACDRPLAQNKNQLS